MITREKNREHRNEIAGCMRRLTKFYAEAS